jgi:hypothetical protein
MRQDRHSGIDQHDTIVGAMTLPANGLEGGSHR